QTVEHLLVERESLLRRCLRPADVRGGEQDLIATKAGIERRQPSPAAEEQSRADDEHQRERNLRDDERLTQAETTVPLGDTTPLRLHRRLWVDASGAPRRHEAEQQPGEGRDTDREQEHPLIDA